MNIFLPSRKTVLIMLSILLLTIITAPQFNAQKRRLPARNRLAGTQSLPKNAIVINEKLSVLRFEPSLLSIPLQRFSHGREMLISGEKEVEGVKFYRVSATNQKAGWIQAEAVMLPNRQGEDEKLARLIQVSEGFEQLERINIFLENFPNSALRPPILLLAGDLAEGAAQKLSGDANKRLDAGEIRASGASVRSWFLNYNGLDRYRRQGLIFLFNEKNRRFHYLGTTWQEVLTRFPKSAEAAEAKKRLDSLKTKMSAEGKAL